MKILLMKFVFVFFCVIIWGKIYFFKICSISYLLCEFYWIIYINIGIVVMSIVVVLDVEVK